MDTSKNVPIPTRFTVRVYAFVVNARNELLVSRENIRGIDIVKLPGGGVDFGEGPKRALNRELKEELGVDLEIGNLVYATDFFVQSALDPEEQVIGIYYLVSAVNNIISLEERMDDFRGQQTTVKREWFIIAELKDDLLTFEMDKRALLHFRKVFSV